MRIIVVVDNYLEEIIVSFYFIWNESIFM